METTRIWKLVGAVVACAALASCGGGDTDQPSGGETPPADAGTGTGTDADSGTGDEGSGDAELDAIAIGLRAALNADRIEVADNTMHIYITGSESNAAGTECVVAASVVPDGTTVIIDRDGIETTC